MVARKFSVLPPVAQPVFSFKSKRLSLFKPGIVRRLLTGLLKAWYKKGITAKPYNGTGCHLYYEKAQHLMFAFKQKIAYEPLLQAKARKYIQPGDTVFDIGGNIGQYALYFSGVVGGSGQVITVEPDHKNFSFLHFNVHANDLKNTTCLKKGIGSRNGFLEFYRDTETGGRKGTFERKFTDATGEKNTERVAMVTLDRMIETYGEPAFIKIDVEGFEDSVLKGLSVNLPNTNFLIEVREETKRCVFAYFEEKGYTCYYVDDREDVRITDGSQIPGFANLLFTKTTS